MIAALLLAVDFMNFDYRQNACHDPKVGTVQMRKGEFSYAGGADWGYELHVLSVTEGSLTPATRQAVVVMDCIFPVDGGVAGAFLYDEHGDSATFVAQVAEAQWGGDWGEPPESMHIRFAGGFLYVDQCEIESLCSNGHYVVTTYARRNGKIVKVYEEKHRRTFP